MRGSLQVDLARVEHGPSTPALRAILLAWSEIDWLEPSGVTDEELVRTFQEHSRLAHAHVPALFPSAITPRVILGGWTEFAAWCKRVQTPRPWDWRFGPLKQLSRVHTEARGWSVDTEAAPGAVWPNPRSLFVRVPGTGGSATALWNVPCRGPSLDGLAPAAQACARFFLDHTWADLFHALEWQLAERHADTTTNPFSALLRCYRAGGLPFSLGRDAVVLFRFAADAAALPRAIVR